MIYYLYSTRGERNRMRSLLKTLRGAGQFALSSRCLLVLILAFSFFLALLLRLTALIRVSLSSFEIQYALAALNLLREGRASDISLAPAQAQLLSLLLFILGKSDYSVRALNLLLSLVAIGSLTAYFYSYRKYNFLTLSFILSISLFPSWVALSSFALPEGSAVFLTLSLLPWLISARSLLVMVVMLFVVGFIFGLGITGICLSIFLLALALYHTRRSGWTHFVIAYLVASWLLGVIFTLSYGFTRLPALKYVFEGGYVSDPLDSPVRILVYMITSAPFLVLILATCLLAYLRLKRYRGLHVDLYMLLSLLAMLLLGGLLVLLVDFPIYIILMLATLIGCWFFTLALTRLLQGRDLMVTLLAVFLFVAAITSLTPWSHRALALTGDGYSEMGFTPQVVSSAFDRVVKVSREVYRLDRTVSEPEGGRAMTVGVSQELAYEARWYLSDLRRVNVGKVVSSDEAYLTTSSSLLPREGYVVETIRGNSLGNQYPQSVLIAWRQDIWKQIRSR